MPPRIEVELSQQTENVITGDGLGKSPVPRPNFWVCLSILYGCSALLLCWRIFTTEVRAEAHWAPMALSPLLHACWVAGAIICATALCAIRRHRIALTLHGPLIALLLMGVLLYRPSLSWDATGYYSYARSLVFDGDLDFKNDLQVMPTLGATIFETPVGRLGNPFPIGPSLLWLPGLALLRPVVGGVGTEAPYLIYLALAGLLSGAIVLAITYSAIHRSGHEFAVIGMLTLLSTQLPYYTWFDAAWSHAYQCAASALLLWVVVRWQPRGTDEPVSVRRITLIGSVLGFALGINFLIRWQSAMAVILVVPLLVAWFRHLSNRRYFLLLLTSTFLAGLLTCLPQLLSFWYFQGHPLRPPSYLPEFFRLDRPNIIGVLFSTWNGLIIYHPVYLLGAACLAWVVLQGGAWRWQAAAVLLWMTVEVYICSCTLDWWAAGGFGQRRLLGFAPWIAWGVALAAGGSAGTRSRSWRPLVFSVLILFGLNFLQTIAITEFYLPRNPADPGNYFRTGLADKGMGPWDYGSWSKLVFDGYVKAVRVLFGMGDGAHG